MGTPDQRARDKDRDEAVRVVDAACAAGQIIEADRLKRVEELRNARTLGEIAMVTHDLRPVPTQAPAPALAPAAPAPAAPASTLGRYEVERGSVWDPGWTPHWSVGAVAAAAILIILMIVGGGSLVGLVDIGSGDGDSTGQQLTGPSPSPQVRLDLLTRGHYKALVQATERTTGSTRAVRLVLERLSAEVEIPGLGGARTSHLFWNGAVMIRQSGKPSGATRQFDLNQVDVGVVRSLVAQARRGLGPEAPYSVAVVAPRQANGAMYFVTAGRGKDRATVVATADGSLLPQGRS